MTVASFGNEELIVNKFIKYLKGNHLKSYFKSQLIGLAVGFSDFCQYAVYTIVFLVAARFLKNVEKANEAENIFIAIFAIMFGAFSAGQAKQYGPSTGKGL